ncbi:T9SS type A sorting domain-containing protein [Flavobacterium sedimenticola]|uniref:T9SS type A sorting domain-containing protein n=1 Tax=Flavobacterium sedimenticola TaxID=3043286 RepID=A0ABT6XTG6_9FLAO|nr:T9SS type A sorting domain-containing protein [Flavobacterium sedimenticola]MDI9257899.1 T9SS type A sorting domain-containing protein [Flavobacterium sedimenticola]
MKKLLLCIILTMGYCSEFKAQNWTFHKSLPTDVIPKDIDSNNAGTMFMLTQDQRIFYKPLSSGTWTEIPTYNSGVMNANCISVHKSQNFLVYGDSYAGGLVYTSNLGWNWNREWFITGDNTGLHEDIMALSNERNNNFFGGGFFIEGSTVYPIITRYGTDASEMYFLDPTNDENSTPEGLYYTSNLKLLIGTEGNGIWITQNNGDSFQQTNYFENKITDFAETNTGRVYALGKETLTNTSLLLYSDDYINWTPTALPNTTEDFTTIYYENATNSLWAGSKSGIYKLSLANSDNVWASNSLNNQNPIMVEIIGDNNGGLYSFSTDKGAQKMNSTASAWNNINNGLHGLVAYHAIGQNNSMVAANRSSNNVSVANTFTSPWTKTSLRADQQAVNGLYTLPNGKIFASLGKSLKKSIDNGQTYSDITPSNFNNGVIDVFRTGEAGSLFAVGRNNRMRVYWSQNEGQNWSVLNTFTSNDPGAYVRDVSQDANGVIFVIVESTDSFFGQFKVYYSTDQGVTWSSRTMVNSNLNGFNNLLSKNDRTFVVIGGKYFKFNFATATNTFVQVLPPSGFQFISVLSVDNNYNYYCILNSNVYKSTNEGQSWTNMGTPGVTRHPYVQDNDNSSKVVLFDNQNNAYIKINNALDPTESGYYKLNQTLDINDADLDNLISIYPNPAQNLININTNNIIKEIAIYDLLGKRVSATPITENTIDVSQLSKGIYIVEVTGDNDAVFSTKFIKE